MYRREEQLEDGKIIKTFRTISTFFNFFPLNLIAVSHRMQPWADPAFSKAFLDVSDAPSVPTVVQK